MFFSHPCSRNYYKFVIIRNAQSMAFQRAQPKPDDIKINKSLVRVVVLGVF